MTLFLSIFKWILYSTALGSVLGCIILLIKLLFKERLGVRWHYCIWLLLVIRLIIPYGPQSSLSVFNLFYLAENKITQINDASNCIIVKTMIEPTESQLPISMEQKDEIQTYNMTKPIIHTKENILYKPIETEDNHVSFYFKLSCLIWIIGIIILGFYSITINIKFKLKLRNQQNCKDKNISNLVSQCKSKIGLNTNIKILTTDLVKTPAIFGFIQPKLLLPVDIDKQISINELQYIIFHELSHLKRKDIPVNCITCIFQILHWFNPILWYSFYRMRQDREVACDALALSYVNPDECIKYGQTLIKLLENHNKTKGIYEMTCIINNKSQIKRRITMISLFKKNSYKWSIIPIVVLIVMGCIMLTNPKSNSVLASDKNSNQKLEAKEGRIFDRNGQELENEKDIIGVKYQYDKYLSLSENSTQSVGKDVVLTIDDNIQNFCEKAAEKALKDNKAKAVSIIVMNPNNGEILSLVNKEDNTLNSSYENEKNSNKNQKKYTNRAINTAFEPGSIFKVITAAAVLNEKVVDLDTYEIECNGGMNVGEFNISCWKKSGHGKENFENIIKNSCNVGFIDLSQKLGIEKLNQYIKAFGFGAKTGIDLPGEVSGIIKETKDISSIDSAVIPLGQVDTSTPIQYLTAFNAVANGGKWIRPHVMKEIIHYDNNNKIVDKTFDNYGAKQILNETTAVQLRGYLEKVVSEGGAKNTYIEGYHIAGKTGTTQKVIDGHYESGKYIASFVGMVPFKDTKKPKITVFVSIDEPDSSNYYAGQIAAPVGKQIFNDIFSYYAVKPDLSKN